LAIGFCEDDGFSSFNEYTWCDIEGSSSKQPSIGFEISSCKQLLSIGFEFSSCKQLSTAAATEALLT
jgi:hypothetical protein